MRSPTGPWLSIFGGGPGAGKGQKGVRLAPNDMGWVVSEGYDRGQGRTLGPELQRSADVLRGLDSRVPSSLGTVVGPGLAPLTGASFGHI